MREEKLPAAEQYGPYTTETAKIIGRGLNVSPRKIDFSIRKVTGLLGKTLVTTPVDAALRATGIAEDLRPARRITEIPIFGDFFTETRAGGADSIDRFYRDFGIAETAHYSERGPRNEREKQLVDVLPSMRQVYSSLSEYRREERAIHKAKTWGDLFEFGTRNMPADQKITPEVKFNPHIHDSNVILAEHGGDIIFLEEPNIFEVEFAAMKGEVILCKLSQEDFDKLKNQLLDAHKELDAIKAEKNGILNDLRSILNISMKYA